MVVQGSGEMDACSRRYAILLNPPPACSRLSMCTDASENMGALGTLGGFRHYKEIIGVPLDRL